MVESTKPFLFPTAKNHGTLPKTDAPPAREPSESALDHGVEESFPASDPVSVTLDKVSAPQAVSAHGPHRISTRPVLRTALIAGAGASLLSTAALMLLGRRHAGSPFAGTNAVSHWLWGTEALTADRPSLRHTAIGYATHHLAATFWAALYAWVLGRREARTVPEELAGAAAMTAVSYIVDYTVTPERLRPGFEHRLPGGALYVVYGAFAIGLAAGCRLARR